MPDSVLEGLSVEGREAMWRQVLSRRSHQEERVVLVIEADGKLAGFCSGGPARGEDLPPKTAEIYAMYVEPSLIGTGLGRILLGHTEEDLRSRGYDSAVLWVLEGNAGARRFYERAGWHADAATKTEKMDGSAVTEVRYRKDLRLA
jgi:GNAT superfamily N-acetyltransferase